MYIMLCGYPPFYGENDTDVLAKVRIGTFTFVQADWKHVSTDATELITKMLKKDPAQRFTAAQSLEHTWIRDKAPKATEFNLSNNIMSNLRGFMSGNKLKRAALHVIATHLDEGQIKNLRALFMSLDVNGDGQLTVTEM
jgi:calcium-dependent protein kinase